MLRHKFLVNQNKLNSKLAGEKNFQICSEFEKKLALSGLKINNIICLISEINNHKEVKMTFL
jgi:hypothetical protein